MGSRRVPSFLSRRTTPVGTSKCLFRSEATTQADNNTSPTVGKILAWSPEEIVIKPETLDPPAKVDVRIHFPRLGFAAKPVKDVEKNEQIEKKEVERREEPEKAKL